MSLVLVKEAAKWLVTPVYSFVYRGDRAQVVRLVRKYHVGAEELIGVAPRPAWEALERSHEGFRLLAITPSLPPLAVPPFVYETAEASYLRRFREECRLDERVRDARDEYDAMLRLGAWLGTRWDHGTDVVPGGNLVCNPVEVIAAGERGAKFWCEIAAKTAVHAATALQWTARLATASRDGRTWEHAVAELWSNRFGKWFVLDTDFNVVYERAGLPLSAFELVHHGEALQERGELLVRNFAPPKPSLPYQDLLPFYRYVHIDLRNDWCSRSLARGSPSGGDLATWWTARLPLQRLVTAKPRVNDQERFDWQVNSTAVHPLSVRRDRDGRLVLELGLVGYSPTFSAFEISVDQAGWTDIRTGHSLCLERGRHTIGVRLATRSGYAGPAAEVKLEWS